jgi:hypothetical protein
VRRGAGEDAVGAGANRMVGYGRGEAWLRGRGRGMWITLNKRLVLLQMHAAPIAGDLRVERDPVAAREILCLRLRIWIMSAFMPVCVE